MIDAIDTSTNVKSHLLYMPERRKTDAEAALKMAVKCPAGNGPHAEKRNFKCVEFNGVKFKNEDLSSIAAHYSKFTENAIGLDEPAEDLDAILNEEQKI